MSDEAVAKTIEDVPADVLVKALLGKVSEAVIGLRIRPAVESPHAKPRLLFTGKGDWGDQLGLLNVRRVELETLVGMQAVERIGRPAEEKP